jgi:hypothetical protein
VTVEEVQPTVSVALGEINIENVWLEFSEEI